MGEGQQETTGRQASIAATVAVVVQSAKVLDDGFARKSSTDD